MLGSSIFIDAKRAEQIVEERKIVLLGIKIYA
jgi:hypothetical protein